jgi:hypothetical protein
MKLKHRAVSNKAVNKLHEKPRGGSECTPLYEGNNDTVPLIKTSCHREAKVGIKQNGA